MTTSLECIEPDAAGIDVGSFSHFVAVPSDRDEKSVKEFSAFTSDIHALADWLKKCGVKTVAMESTGVYWIPLYEILEERGFQVCLVNARYIKNVSGRKSDVLDCQWIQQLHSYGLLRPSFRPEEDIIRLRQLVRHRGTLVKWSATHIQHMQKALSQMNLQLHNVVSDITGITGMKIIRSICDGEQDPKKLAAHRDGRCDNSEETIAKSLQGHYKAELLFSLKQALSSYDHYQKQIAECNEEIRKITETFEDKTIGQPSPKYKRETNKKSIGFDAQTQFFKILGVNLTEIPGINSLTIMTFVSEVGTSVDKWTNAKAFASWLGLCPGTKISGGKRLSSKSKPCANRLAEALRMAASTLSKSQTSLGAFLRRLKARLGPAKAITAVAHKMAVIIYNMIKNQAGYREAGLDYYDKQHKERAVKNLRRFAERLGYTVAPQEAAKTAPLNSHNTNTLQCVI
jgi:transposase